MAICECGAAHDNPYYICPLRRCGACHEIFAGQGPFDLHLATCRPKQGPDMVNHPPHYIGHPSGVECITITRHMNFNLGNALKYIWRAGNKGSMVEDLKKAAWYLADEIGRLEGEKK